jgi:hypothetical protein
VLTLLCQCHCCHAAVNSAGRCVNTLELAQGVVHLLLQGLGVVRAALSCAGRLPDHVYVSHNHTDHAGTFQGNFPADNKLATTCCISSQGTNMGTYATFMLNPTHSSDVLISYSAFCAVTSMCVNRRVLTRQERMPCTCLLPLNIASFIPLVIQYSADGPRLSTSACYQPDSAACFLLRQLCRNHPLDPACSCCC